MSNHDKPTQTTPASNDNDLRPEHPSVMIQEELDARGWTVDELAIRMGDNPPRNRLVLDLYMQLGPEKLTMELGRPTAEQLGCAFDVAPELFLNLHDAWRRARLS